MDEQNFQFRTAVFGGFQKQDVVAYLEKSARDHAQRIAGLQKQVEEAKAAVAQGGEKAEAQDQRLTALEAENRRLSADLAERERLLAAATAECEELRKKSAELQTKVDALAPAAAAYEGVKERAANIELDAHTRAQAIEKESREKTQREKEQLQRWVERVKEEYRRLCDELLHTQTQAVSTMEDSNKILRELNAEIAQLETDVGHVAAVTMPEPLPVAESAGPQPTPAPVPDPASFRELW